MFFKLQSSTIARLVTIIRFYGVGIVNTIFGYTLFFSLIALNINIYVAQLLGHSIGMAFNYFMFTRHVFVGTKPAMARYLAAYGVNYVFGLVLIMAFSQIFKSPFAIGAASAITASAINFVVLKSYVFHRTQDE